MGKEISSTPLCSRCKKPAKIHIPDTPRCEACFILYLQRTFKQCLGRLNAGGRRTIAVALSGGESSAAAAILLRDYHAALSVNPKLARAKILLIHIQRSMSSTTSEQPPSILKKVHEAIPNSHLIIEQQQEGDNHEEFNLNHLRDVTDKTQFETFQIQQRLLKIAKQHECSTIILGTTVSRAACNVLLDVATSRGTRVHSDAHPVVDDYINNNNVRFIRPLSTIPIRLVVRFARIMFPNPDVQFVQTVLPSRSLQHVVERFVAEVTHDNPSSVHNVVRVADRLLEQPIENAKVCPLCNSIVAMDRRRNEEDEEVITRKNNNNNVISCSSIQQQNGNGENMTNGQCQSCECSNGGESKLFQQHNENNSSNINGGNGLEKKDNFVVCSGCTGCIERAGGKNSPDNPIMQLLRREAMRKEIEDFLL